MRYVPYRDAHSCVAWFVHGPNVEEALSQCIYTIHNYNNNYYVKVVNCHCLANMSLIKIEFTILTKNQVRFHEQYYIFFSHWHCKWRTENGLSNDNGSLTRSKVNLRIWLDRITVKWCNNCPTDLHVVCFKNPVKIMTLFWQIYYSSQQMDDGWLPRDSPYISCWDKYQSEDSICSNAVNDNAIP